MEIIGGILVLIIGLHLPLWFVAKKRNVFKKLDYVFPFIPITFYLILNALGISKQSITNLAIEVAVIVLITFIAYIIKIFTKYKNIKLLLGVLFTFIVLFVLIMPLIKE